MTTQQESFDKAVNLLEQARAVLVAAGRADLAVDAPVADASSANVSGDVEPSSWQWLHGQLVGLYNRLRGTWDWCKSNQGREVARRALGLVRDSATEAARTVSGALRGDMQSIAKLAGTAFDALGALVPGFGGWIALGLLVWTMTRGRE